MGLIDRLRPRWHHSDPEVRAAAVRELGREDHELLGAVAREDEDARVRRIAVKKLDDPRLLLEVAERDPDESLREFAAGRALDALVAQATSDLEITVCAEAVSRLSDPRQLATVAITAFHSAIRAEALSRLSHEKALGEVAKKASDAAIRDQALCRITDLSVLRSVASGDSPSEVALAAIERIDDPDTLYAVAENRAAHKSVRQRAQARLDLLITDEHPIRVGERRQRQLQLCLAVETLASEAHAEQVIEELGRLRKEWDDLAVRTSPAEEIAQRFDVAYQVLLDELAREERQRANDERREAAVREDLSARLGLCEQAESLEGDGALRALEETRAAWDRLGPLPENDQARSVAERFARACERCESRLERWQARQASLSKLERLVIEAEQLARAAQITEAHRHWAALEHRWATLESSLSPGDRGEEERGLRARFAGAGEALASRWWDDHDRRERERNEHLAQLTHLCAQLEEMARAENFDLQAADRELRTATTVLNQLGPLPSSESRTEWKARLSEARRQLFQRLQQQKETEKWRRWANVDLQEKLIQQAESLLQADDPAKAERELRRIQEEWKRFSAAPRDRSEALWERFRTIRDELRGRCNAYLTDNVRKKEALCEQAEALAESTDWKQTTAAIQQLQAEWKQIGPAPHKTGQALWGRFRAACDRFFERRNEHFGRLKQERKENARKKTELCAQAEALADSTDWERVTEELKQLQAEWKRIGPVSRKESEALWSRFRAACDRFFERRSRRGEVQAQAQLEKALSVCAELESVVASLASSEAPPPAIVAQTVKESWSAWTEIGPFPRESAEALHTRFRTACEQLAAAGPDALRGTELDPRTSTKKREKLCARLEALVNDLAETVTQPSLENLAERLKQALAANTIGGREVRDRRKDWRAAAEEVDRLRSKWDRLGPVLGEGAQSLAERFERAGARFFELRQSARSHGADRRTRS